MAASGFYRLDIQQGSSFTITLTIKDAAGLPLNLSGYGIRTRIRPSFGSTGDLGQFSGSIVVPEASGIIALSGTAVFTSGVPVTQAAYGVEVFNSGESDVFKVLGGYIYVAPEVNI